MFHFFWHCNPTSKTSSLTVAVGWPVDAICSVFRSRTSESNPNGRPCQKQLERRWSRRWGWRTPVKPQGVWNSKVLVSSRNHICDNLKYIYWNFLCPSLGCPIKTMYSACWQWYYRFIGYDILYNMLIYDIYIHIYIYIIVWFYLTIYVIHFLCISVWCLSRSCNSSPFRKPLVRATRSLGRGLYL